MSGLVWFLVTIALALTLAYTRSKLPVWTLAFAGLLGVNWLISGSFPLIGTIVFLAVAIPLNVTPLRRNLFSRKLLAWFRSVMPPISQTERVALDAGNTWWDADLFTGKPDWNKLLSYPSPQLSDEEQAFVDGPTEALCKMLDDWEITHEKNDLPAATWDFIREKGFFGMIIPKEYGGHGFSALAHSSVVMKVASRSPSAGVTVMVPNSLGPGELLLHYGTDKQKDYYLPRLAKGEEIPCFALTGPHAGSDAGALPDTGIVCKGEHNGKEVLGFRITWDKRYITLAPVATLLGVAFKAYDPDGLLGDKKSLGITLALIPTDTPGVEIGQRHFPLNASFQNGPTRGKDVFVPMEHLIGGQDFIGEGWRMLMNCLSVGRAISLPALGTGAGKISSRTTGAYARVRKQFKTPIGKFEGVEEAMTRIGGYTYRMEAMRRMTAGALDLGEKPSVLSAILKYHCTEGMRQVVNDAMDIHAGKGVMMGPSNYLARTYQSIPISITVEGANILTRGLMIFGQGAIRCHPYLLKEMECVGMEDEEQAVAKFDRALFSHVGFTISNAVRAFVTGLTRGLFIRSPEAGEVSRYYKQFSRMSSAFAFSADVALLLLGGELKRKEKLSARFGDVLSHLYMGSAMLKQFEDQGRPASDLPLVHWACQDSLHTIEDRLNEIFRNFPSPLLGRLVKWVVMPTGSSYRRPTDKLGHEVASLLLTPSAARDRLTRGVFISNDPADPVGKVEYAMERMLAAEPLEARLQKGLGVRLTPNNLEEHLQRGVEEKVIAEQEAEVIRESAKATAAAIAVDELDPERAPEAHAGKTAKQAAKAS
ncbi:acyl-CoA dehydrogenase [Natronospira proteinivora]|uniref:Acyl-coenzyme A dehydrogenase n=1 Tax=Natronospira proteinivora TaxID=1807133 RepID=A0ABT1G5L9_9GAMM|nr:acyl-CoA dehydrogenase [Natronospira proteinivora]MCP1726235.1 acyl-CoA dehydrogenase [Natronospira proteinivora]